MGNSFKKFSLCVAAAASSAATLLAQPDIDNMITNATTSVKTTGRNAITLAEYIFLVVGAVIVIVQGIKMARKDPQASDGWMTLGIVFVGVFLFLKLIQNWLS